jgi:hypothetical protein
LDTCFSTVTRFTSTEWDGKFCCEGSQRIIWHDLPLILVPLSWAWKGEPLKFWRAALSWLFQAGFFSLPSSLGGFSIFLKLYHPMEFWFCFLFFF